MRHFEILIEDRSGEVMIESFIRKIIRPNDTFTIHSYRGIGRIPPGLRPGTDAAKRILLDSLPRVVQGYGNAFKDDPADYKRVVLIVCDLDKRDYADFLAELEAVVAACNPSPDTRFCLAVEEGEAWLLGDVEAVLTAYPKVNLAELEKYTPDAICGTWEFLADLVVKGGARALKAAGFYEVGRAKIEWAAKIGEHMVPARNRSPSFKRLVEQVNR